MTLVAEMCQNIKPTCCPGKFHVHIGESVGYVQHVPKTVFVWKPQEMVRRLQSAATLAIHLRAAEPDWSVT